MSSLSAEEGEMKLNKLCIYSIKGVAKHILYMTKYICNGKNLQIKPIDSNFDNKQFIALIWLLESYLLIVFLILNINNVEY